MIVAGGGNAALCAAIKARRAGARALVHENAWRGGNSKHTRNLRVIATDYPTEELTANMTNVTGEGIGR
jgi:tricarballylate dehydrogenase